MDTGTEQETLRRYEEASSYLQGLIQGPPSPPPDATDEEIRARAVARNERLRAFLEFLGNPHLQYTTLHIAGTSGKGSTSAFLASILTSAGLRTGLHVSPYLQVETEKLQINDQLMSVDSFADHVAALDAEVQRWVEAGHERLTYGEFWVALTFYSLHRENCDIVVTETGAGGRFDLTNVVQPAVSVITSVGLDHVRTLGETIPEIAWHKAGIIKDGVPAVTTVADPEALEVIREEARLKQSELIELRPGEHFEWDWRGDEGGFLRMDDLSRPARLPLPGAFQASNAALAVQAARLVAQQGIANVPVSAIEQGIEATRFPGRVEVVQQGPQVVLDGAHNPEKMRALTQAIDDVHSGGRRIVVLGSLGGHDFLQIAEVVARVADEVIITAPSAVERSSAPVEEIAERVRQTGRPHQVTLNPSEAIEAALSRARSADQIVVTGSLYLVGMVRERWYPSQAILRQQTPFPEVSDS